jgi:hypothetical protein
MTTYMPSVLIAQKICVATYMLHIAVAGAYMLFREAKFMVHICPLANALGGIYAITYAPIHTVK